MARYPNAQWRPLGPQTEPRLTKKNKIIMHTMVGTLWGTDHYFRDPNGPGYSGTESHFGTDPNEVVQWQDTTHQADAQLEGNDDCISIETADHGGPYGDWSGSDVPAWTPEHLEINSQLVAWLCRVHDIPAVLITNTRDATEGIGYHRQGIDPYRDEGEHYSTSFGKVCPGDRRVAQMPGLIARVRQILNGDDMPLDENDLDQVEQRARAAMRGVLNEKLITPYDYTTGQSAAEDASVLHVIDWIHTNIVKLRREEIVPAVVRGLENAGVTVTAEQVDQIADGVAAHLAAGVGVDVNITVGGTEPA